MNIWLGFVGSTNQLFSQGIWELGLPMQKIQIVFFLCSLFQCRIFIFSSIMLFWSIQTVRHNLHFSNSLGSVMSKFCRCVFLSTHLIYMKLYVCSTGISTSLHNPYGIAVTDFILCCCAPFIMVAAFLFFVHAQSRTKDAGYNSLELSLYQFHGQIRNF